GTWSSTGSMSVGRSSGSFSLLNDGKVLAAGGYDGTSHLSSAEFWDPGTDTWSATAPLADARASHTATVLGNGKVLVAVGADDAGCCLSSAEQYTEESSISTALSQASIVVGGNAHDSATLSDVTSDASGSVTYSVYDNPTCTGGPVKDGGTKT